MTIITDQSLPSLKQLPHVFAIDLNHLSAISLMGEDQNKYLQGQVTCDVNNATENTLMHGAHCDAKGKVFSVFRFIQRNGANLLIQPKVTVNASLAELKKFGVFAKVTIESIENLSFLALCGKEAKHLLSQTFNTLPNETSPVITENSASLVYIAGKIPKYLIIDETEKLNTFVQTLNISIYGAAVWNLLEIIEGFPTLNESAISAYVPQMLNLQAIDAISFTKGCYLGQETVARMQYLGKNKRALFTLTGTSDLAIEHNSIIEKQLGENWRKAGDLLISYTADNGEKYLQAVLSSDTDESSTHRIKDSQKSNFHLLPLPYSLITQD